MTNVRDILNKYWGYTSFKPMQEEIMASVLDGKDTVALLPTGGGKSLCFQVPALAMDGICIVVSPLVALMGDQVNALKERGIKALKLTGGISFDELNTLLDNALYGNYKFLYLSPERLQQEIVQNYIKQMNVNLIAVDEAHCISQWGNDFRPAYKNITVLRDLHPLVPIIALTATATPEVLEDTISELKMELPAIFKNSFARENLSYQVFKEDDKLYRTEQLLKNNKGSAIVYVRNRKGTIEISEQLNSLGISATFYHGGISAKDKAQKLTSWRNARVSTMVATNAFGMGIDHANVRFVIHLQIPESLESYFQEAGRAGRDGEYAAAVLLYNEYDKIYVKQQFVESLPTTSDLKKIYRTLNNYFQIPYGEGEFSKHNFGFSEFCKTYNLNTLLAYNALNNLDRLGIVQLSQEFGRKSTVQFLISSEKVLTYFEKDITASVIGKTILRIYGGIFEMPTSINLDLIVSKTGQSIETVITNLKKMERDQVIEMTLQITDATLTFLVPREDDKTINVISREVEALNRKKAAQVNSVLRYIENTKTCRSVQLVSYFGETTASKCGVCSVCKGQASKLSKKEIQQLATQILALLEEAELTSREISERLTFTETDILKVLRLLMDSEKIKTNPKNQYYLN
ncbi:RecQ family ATP-dependent DNA helicase [Aequorivita lipolytica]|uniref:ATP-dependent DNA helicase RecQ n=1 Tax=Aequorivita lipolytica TaxID=153267 RepID=A0A5C6YLG0_9FLAO|nr:ATP-dependent DNA helicase RecQ [Aequorivita lipolytica]TXD68247.1 RecQ family ATP-dependent DNA helicase [Aequorivita lipolytica]SRX53475.1 ATP-dependent DNA helicase RecQ [Aequorivita lipolytica]